LQKIRDILNTLCYLRLTPFDTSTEEGRKFERQRKITLSSFTAIVAEAVNYLVMIAMVPILINFLGKEQYGLLLAITSLASLRVLADFGLGNGLINTLGEAYGLNAHQLARELISSSLFVLAAIGSILALVSILLVPNYDWANFFNLNELAAIKVCTYSVVIFLILFSFNLPVSIVLKTQMALQNNHINNLCSVISKVLILICTITAIKYQLSLPFFILIIVGIPIIINLANGAALFYRNYTYLSPSPKFITKSSLKSLIKTGFFFFVTGFSGILALQLDTIIISRYLGADQVPSFSIPLKLFMAASILFSFILTPLWPAYREAIVRNDLIWVKNTFKKTLKISIFVIVPIIFILFIFANPILTFWTGVELFIPLSLLIALSINAVMLPITNSIAMLINGANIFGYRVIFSLANGFTNIIISIYLVKKIGISGPIWGTIISQLIFGWSSNIYYLIKFFRTQSQ
jgi:O-antigen/teichoic acid export membrane protein